MVARTPRMQCFVPQGTQFSRRSRDFTLTHLVIFLSEGLPPAPSPPPTCLTLLCSHVKQALNLNTHLDRGKWEQETWKWRNDGENMSTGSLCSSLDDIYPSFGIYRWGRGWVPETPQLWKSQMFKFLI